jgi:hypothetical protein
MIGALCYYSGILFYNSFFLPKIYVECDSYLRLFRAQPECHLMGHFAVLRCSSLYQHHSEDLNAHSTNCMSQTLTSWSRKVVMLLAADHRRCQIEIKSLHKYKPSPGIVVSMGQDDFA